MIVTLDEFSAAIKLIRDKMRGHETTPVALAMVAEGIHFLVRTGKPDSLLRPFIEQAIAHSRKTTIAAPTQGEMAKILGPMHQKD